MSSGRKLTLLAVFVPLLTGAAGSLDVVGRWRASFDTQIGVQKYVFTFQVDGDKVTGKAAYEREQGKGEADLVDVKLSGDEISFVEPLQFDDQEIRITYAGRISGDEMRLTRQVGEFATEALVARRIREPAEKPPAAS
jgi:hypothetical protein